MILNHRFSAAEVASLADVSLPTLGFYVREGVLTPSLLRASGRGRGNVFDITDVVGLLTMNLLRLPNASAGPLGRLMDFWHSARGRAVIREVVEDRQSASRVRIMVVTEHAIDLDADPAQVMAKRRASVSYCLDVSRVITDLLVHYTEHEMVQAFREPGPAGRVPAKKRARARKQAVSGKKSSVQRARG